jgi:hypothetical protein
MCAPARHHPDDRDRGIVLLGIVKARQFSQKRGSNIRCGRAL